MTHIVENPWVWSQLSTHTHKDTHTQIHTHTMMASSWQIIPAASTHSQHAPPQSIIPPLNILQMLSKSHCWLTDFQTKCQTLFKTLVYFFHLESYSEVISFVNWHVSFVLRPDIVLQVLFTCDTSRKLWLMSKIITIFPSFHMVHLACFWPQNAVIGILYRDILHLPSPHYKNMPTISSFGSFYVYFAKVMPNYIPFLYLNEVDWRLFSIFLRFFYFGFQFLCLVY